jgi:hypothetical protein
MKSSTSLAESFSPWNEPFLNSAGVVSIQSASNFMNANLYCALPTRFSSGIAPMQSLMENVLPKFNIDATYFHDPTLTVFPFVPSIPPPMYSGACRNSSWKTNPRSTPPGGLLGSRSALRSLKNESNAEKMAVAADPSSVGFGKPTCAWRPRPSTPKYSKPISS